MRGSLLATIVVYIVSCAHGQDAPQDTHRIVTTTRLVSVFSQLETDCFKAVQRKDQPTLNSLVSEDFEVWTPEPPGEPIAREDWLDKAEPATSMHLMQMAVRSLSEDIAIVSFVLQQTRKADEKTQSSFVVDVWKQAGKNWRLTERYQSPASLVRARFTKTDKRPTGKD